MKIMPYFESFISDKYKYIRQHKKQARRIKYAVRI